jgi:patatin-like phospholipase/acyl hydrolase
MKYVLYLITGLMVSGLLFLMCGEEPRPEPEPVPVIAEKDLETESAPQIPQVIVTKASADGYWTSYFVNVTQENLQFKTMDGEIVDNIEIKPNTQLQLILINESDSSATFKLSVGDKEIEQEVPAREIDGIIVEIPVFESGEYTAVNQVGSAEGLIKATADTL